MELITEARAMRQWSRAHRAAGRRVSLVPTMGYLHEGHLVAGARGHVPERGVRGVHLRQPTQFAANEDFGSYPRDEQGDLTKLRDLGVHAVFMPTRLYAEADQNATSTLRRGRRRRRARDVRHVRAPAERALLDHQAALFRGVATVVTKLFNVVEPDVAVFGKKDYQQWRVIRRVARDLDFDVDVVGAPLAREPRRLAAVQSQCAAHAGAQGKAPSPSVPRCSTSARHERGDLSEERGLLDAGAAVRARQRGGRRRGLRRGARTEVADTRARGTREREGGVPDRGVVRGRSLAGQSRARGEDA